ncbi:helicase-related protein [Agromyces larvae]|uniref:Helicase C-terminal domain-containing protein n=1 Tax=Agromyces larvae TaxID=2929802 RepID=A0ABY4C7E7_9MICO|nr:helicase-related protein [Agromyces larvae]UOE45928.1 hypothetical protein MTO99_09365 [Agromyces larvae]
MRRRERGAHQRNQAQKGAKNSMKLTPRPQQEHDIQRVLAEPTHSALIGSQPGNGKTLLGTEIALRGPFERVLFIGLVGTFKQWAERIDAQSDGEVTLRRIDSTKAGKQAFADFLAGEPGFYFSGSQYLMRQDWESRPAFEDDGTPQWKRAKKDDPASGVVAGDLILRERKEGAIGPAAEPIRLTESVHLNTFRRKMKKPLDLLVFDEVQLISNRKSNGFQTFHSITTDWKVAMSGTWFGNSPANMWAVGDWLWDGKINPATGKPWVETSFNRWQAQFIALEPVLGKNKQPLKTPRGTPITKVVGEKVPGAFAASLPCYIRRENEEQPPGPKVVYCDPTPQQAAQIADLEEDLLTWVKGWDGEDMPLVVDLPPTLYIRLRQVAIAELSYGADGRVTFASNAASAKLKPLRGLVDYWAGQQVGIFTDSKIGAQFVANRMRMAGYAAEAYTGDLSERERESLKARFIAGEVRYLVGTIQSMGTGIDGLQTACSKVIWLNEVPGNPSANEQALARYFRQGRTREHGEFEHVKLLMRGSVDVQTMETLIEKAWQMSASLRIAS